MDSGSFKRKTRNLNACGSNEQRIPISMLADAVLPFLNRTSWNNWSLMSKEVYLHTNQYIPPWPEGCLAVTHSNPRTRRENTRCEGPPASPSSSSEPPSPSSMFAPIVRTVAFSPDGRTLAIGCGMNNGEKSGKIFLWDRRRGHFKTLAKHRGSINCLSFSSNGSLLASGSHDKTVRVWSCFAKYKCIQVLTGHQGQIRSASFAPDGHGLATAGDDATIRLWNVDTGNCINTRQLVSWSVSLASEGDPFNSFSGPYSGILLWDLDGDNNNNNNSKIIDSSASKASPGDVAWMRFPYSPDGRYLASGGSDFTIRLWDVVDHKCRWVFRGHTSNIWMVEFSPDGHLIVSDSFDNSVRVWNVDDGTCLCVLPCRQRRVRQRMTGPYHPFAFCSQAKRQRAKTAAAAATTPKWPSRSSIPETNILAAGDGSMIRLWNM